jgi:hypothetical protein
MTHVWRGISAKKRMTSFLELKSLLLAFGKSGFKLICCFIVIE